MKIKITVFFLLVIFAQTFLFAEEDDGTFISLTDGDAEVMEITGNEFSLTEKANIRRADPAKVRKWGNRRQDISLTDELDAMLDDAEYSAKTVKKLQKGESLNSEPAEAMVKVTPKMKKDFYEELPSQAAAEPKPTKKAEPQPVQKASAGGIDFSNWRIPTQNVVRVTSVYGFRKTFGRFHKGVDLKVQVGDPIVAVADGVVTRDRYEYRGYGHYIVVKHANGTETRYAHLDKRLVKAGDKVKAGQLIGLGGNTGHSTGSHLHFEIRVKDNAIDPEWVFDFPNGKVKSSAYSLNL